MKIYSPKGPAREYSPLALNPFKGCGFNCTYCYVPGIIGRFNNNYDHTKAVPGDVRPLISQLKNKKFTDQVLISFTGDPYNPFDEEENFLRSILTYLLSKEIKVAILTKAGTSVIRDLDIFKKYGDRIKIGLTLTFNNNEDTDKWEPGTAYPLSRITALQVLKENDIKTWASIEPVISPSQSFDMIKKTVDFVDLYKIGKLNHNPKLERSINWNVFLIQVVEYLREKGKDFYIKKDLQPFRYDFHLTEQETNQDFGNL